MKVSSVEALTASTRVMLLSRADLSNDMTAESEPQLYLTRSLSCRTHKQVLHLPGTSLSWTNITLIVCQVALHPFYSIFTCRLCLMPTKAARNQAEHGEIGMKHDFPFTKHWSHTTILVHVLN